MKRYYSERGFSLVELTIIIVVIGITLAVAMQSMIVVVNDVKRAETEQEMELLANAIVGNAEQTTNSTRSDFGYIGDVGIFPTSLNALRTNVGSMSTWSGPYLLIDHTQDTLSYLLDAWGTAYSYSGGTTITSTGSGSSIVKRIAKQSSYYLRNTITGTITDNLGTAPGTAKDDSIRILIQVPSGASGLVTKTYTVNSSGQFTLDSIPVGARYIRAIYLPANDTVKQYYTVLPNHRNSPPLTLAFATSYFSYTCSNGSFVLRPNSMGATAEISTDEGCGPDYDCVNEVTADNDDTYLYESNSSYQTELFGFPDTSISFCNVTSVAVTCRARYTSTSGTIRVKVYTGGTEYYSTTANMTSSYANYTTTWTTNPSTGNDWTWTDITNLQAGCDIAESGTGEFRLTQVYVTVNYGP